MNTTFNLNRFCQVLKWTILTEKKSILTAAIAFTAAFLAIQLFSCFTIFDINRSLGYAATVAGIVTCTAIVNFMNSYYASGVLGNARNSQERITAMMLPASNLEKFAARIVYCCIFMLLLLHVSACAATGLRMLLEWMAGHSMITGGFDVLFGNYEVQSEIGLTTFHTVALTCWSTSLFVLGGVFFRKRPFVWTYVTLIAAALLLFTLTFYIVTLIGEDSVGQFLKSLFGEMSAQQMLNWASVVFLAFTVLNVWLSYRLFCRLQVVQHKWFNL